MSEPRWWGPFHFELGQIGRWRLGSLDLRVRRTDVDWRYGFEQGEDPLDERYSVELPASDLEPTDEDLEDLVQASDPFALHDEHGRFGVAETRGTIEVLPALADRPVVARPAVPFSVPPGETIELFLSTPLWVQLRVEGTVLADLPCLRPSDTWFGSNTRGELAFATKTHLRRHIEQVKPRPHRAVSCLTIKNRSEEVLGLERLSLPVPQLSLFAGPSGALWTEHVTVTKEGEQVAGVSLGTGPPHHAGRVELVAEPRVSHGMTFASLVFGGLFETAY